jgi:GTP-binding protein YchF
MALNCGIVGLPNVGKSTIFSALTSAPAEAANYPFCTINPNVGIVDVPDARLRKLAEIFKPKRVVPATVEFVDIAGLVKGASQGEGLGNQFLSHIREVGVIAQVVRCFEDPDIIHVSNKVDPASDIETINVELALADLETVQKRLDRAQRALKVQAKDQQKLAEAAISACGKLTDALQQGRPARSVPLADDEKAAMAESQLITMKPQLYVCNVDEDGMKSGNRHIDFVKTRAAEEGSEAVVICGKFEAELSDLESEEERLAFLAEIGLSESGLSALIHAAYRLMGLRTFFTAGEDECRAWTIRAGDSAPRAAGVIHTDFEKGFIKAETYAYEDLLTYGSEAKIKEAGKYRIEGKDYIVRDGDIMFFKFNV